MFYSLFPPPGVSRLYWDGEFPNWLGPIAGDLELTPWGPSHPSPRPPTVGENNVSLCFWSTLKRPAY